MKEDLLYKDFHCPFCGRNLRELQSVLTNEEEKPILVVTKCRFCDMIFRLTRDGIITIFEKEDF